MCGGNGGQDPETHRHFPTAAMTSDDVPADEARLAEAAETLTEAIEVAIPGWVERCVERLAVAYAGEASVDTRAAATAAGRRAATDVGAEVRRLLAVDVDEQRANPLAVLRSAVRYPTEVLAAAGVPPVVRDEFAERAFPADVYGLAPA